MQLFFTEHTNENQFTLDAEESKHLIKVLRKTQGDRVHFTNGKGCLYHCIIIDANPKKAIIKIEEREFQPEDDYYIHLAISPTKNSDRMEWMVEKLTEIGVHEITFMESEFSERSHLKLERLEKKIIAASKQSLKTWLPKLNPVRPMNELVQDSEFNSYQRFIAYVDKENDRHLFDKAKPDNAYLILIGPEGDFSNQEIQLAFDNHFLPCSLGKSRLRSETAAVAAVHTLQLINNLKEL
ncbi:16S rRNA (uracil(1498)-N(3))-methyltransferase [Belliella pelovolcani]|jgi:16S rRNA (uracil1498-N3)-methyltransferase|uniref:Ribosomal RNA small subunit methyltransferase E n=1 Tax=Belliella pelovolcani TaxID=529505 RepID=A0A1N7LC84_9BACT|nr:16S rRNA (uracil(1498)-N(3))-methyltransferase [Belliella pelovolcani]SIS71391.1 16S rRNA (uracil1498-N3)-methyltransferase [Belliella pelovolcani]